MLALRTIVRPGLAYTLLMLLAWTFPAPLAFGARHAAGRGSAAHLRLWPLARQRGGDTHRRATSRGRTDRGIAVYQCRGDGETPLPAAADLPPPPVARQPRQRQAGPLPDPAVSRRRGSARADGDGDGRGGCRGGAGRGGPDSRVRAQ